MLEFSFQIIKSNLNNINARNAIYKLDGDFCINHANKTIFLEKETPIIELVFYMEGWLSNLDWNMEKISSFMPDGYLEPIITIRYSENNCIIYDGQDTSLLTRVSLCDLLNAFTDFINKLNLFLIDTYAFSLQDLF